LGLQGISIDQPSQIQGAWQTALSASKPVLIQARVDPDVVPFPPHVTLKQARSFGMSLLKGDSEEGGIIKQAVQQMFPSLGEKS
jgi:pyruvate dehydrogenase (quinone)